MHHTLPADVTERMMSRVCSTASEDGAAAPASARKTETYAVEGIEYAPRAADHSDFVEDSMSEGAPSNGLTSIRLRNKCHES